LGSLFSNDIDNTNVNKVEEELKRGNLAASRRSPQQALMEVLTDLRKFEEFQGIGRAILVILVARRIVRSLQG